MSGHLPECTVYLDGTGDCICDRLRACEARVLDAARGAVAALWVHEVTDVPGWGIDETHVWPEPVAAVLHRNAIHRGWLTPEETP